MIRILIIDDAETPEFLDKLNRDISGGFDTDVYLQHFNPITYFHGGNIDQEEQDCFDAIHSIAGQFWDIALIDINLHEMERPEAEKLNLSLSIAETFREENRSAMILLYSGTLAKHIPKLIGDDTSTSKAESEKVLRRIFHASILSFVPRDEITVQVYDALSDPPLLLIADRLLEKHNELLVQVAESEFAGMSFAQLSGCLRKQDTNGKRVCERIAQLGIASLVDLNK